MSRLIEMIILSTLLEEIRRELLAKPNGMVTANVLCKGTEYEAFIALQASLKTTSAAATATNVDTMNNSHTYGNCCLIMLHIPAQPPNLCVEGVGVKAIGRCAEKPNAITLNSHSPKAVINPVTSLDSSPLVFVSIP